MKKIIALLYLSIYLFTANAQWTTSGTNVYYNGGNVGVGVTSPLAKFEIGNAGSGTFRVGITGNRSNAHSQFANSLTVLGDNSSSVVSNGAVAWDFFNDGVSPSWAGVLMYHYGTAYPGNMNGISASNQATLTFQNVANGVISSNGANIHVAPYDNISTTFLNNGYVGIGTTSPGDKLQVEGGNISATMNPALDGFVQMWSDNAVIWKNGNQNHGLRFGSASSLAAGSWSEKMRITDDGNVLIGTATSGSYKLAVEGTIGARKIKVTQAPWADYVFESDYHLPSLAEVQLFIQKNKHLPGVPSAKEVGANGLDLGDNQAVLLKKIEELTLYLIDQDKKLVDQDKRNEALQNRLLMQDIKQEQQQQQIDLLKKQLQLLSSK